jgi:hypothetical protein
VKRYYFSENTSNKSSKLLRHRIYSRRIQRTEFVLVLLLLFVFPLFKLVRQALLGLPWSSVDDQKDKLTIFLITKDLIQGIFSVKGLLNLYTTWV